MKWPCWWHTEGYDGYGWKFLLFPTRECKRCGKKKPESVRGKRWV